MFCHYRRHAYQHRNNESGLPCYETGNGCPLYEQPSIFGMSGHPGDCDDQGDDVDHQNLWPQDIERHPEQQGSRSSFSTDRDELRGKSLFCHTPMIVIKALFVTNKASEASALWPASYRYLLYILGVRKWSGSH